MMLNFSFEGAHVLFSAPGAYRRPDRHRKFEAVAVAGTEYALKSNRFEDRRAAGCAARQGRS
jgi:hypothetical protein